MNYKNVRNDLFVLIKTPYSDPKHLEKAVSSWVGKNISYILEALDQAVDAEKDQHGITGLSVLTPGENVKLLIGPSSQIPILEPYL